MTGIAAKISIVAVTNCTNVAQRNPGYTTTLKTATTANIDPIKSNCIKAMPIKTILHILVLALVLASATAYPAPYVGFFTPTGVPPELVGKMPFGMINVQELTQFEQNFKRAQGTSFRISVDFGPLLPPGVEPVKLSMRYKDQTGQSRTKVFAPGATNKLRQIPSDRVLRNHLAPFLDILAKYPQNVGSVFLADEPYLNGISKSEMERAGRLVRKELDRRNLHYVPLGVIFAAGMFDREFAELISGQAGEYVKGIDDYYVANKNGANQREFDQWVKIIQNNRLATYDRAGNMYIDGGLPKGFDVIGFDFYLSTILLDNTHEQTLAWLAKHYPQHKCSQFAGQTMSNIRSRLSFFQDGLAKQGMQHQQQDKALLDAIFSCRMGAVTEMLRKAMRNHPHSVKFLMFSESSNNGVLEFDSKGSPKKLQPEKLVAARALDEAVRAQRFYVQNQDFYSAGLIYFTYQNEYDNTIGLNIGGASGMPVVLNNIYSFVKQTLPK